jgi:phosphoserine phosphatase
MVTFKERKTVYFDVDDTLLEWKSCRKNAKNAVRIENNGHVFYKRAIVPNVEGLKAHSLAGHLVVIWSAGGSSWAETVVRALKLQKYVNVILTKPDYYYDDKEVSHWFPAEAQFKTEW